MKNQHERRCFWYAIEPMTGKTGIEIQVGLSPGQRSIGKVLSALHLEKLGELVGKMMELVITLDGAERVEPLYEAHFIEAAVGEHALDLYLRGKGPSSEGLQRALRNQSRSVTVEPGMVTVLVYTPNDGIGSTLELVGTRPA
jgi:hypothetical protein